MFGMKTVVACKRCTFECSKFGMVFILDYSNVEYARLGVILD